MQLPGPRGRTRPTLRIVRNPSLWYHRWLETYGDPFLVRALNGDVVVTASETNIKTIFTARPHVFGAFASETMRSLLGEGVILAMSGSAHLRERKLLLPPFHGARMRAYGEQIIGVAERLSASMMGSERFLALEVGREISREVILRAVFGVDDVHEVEETAVALSEYVDALHPLLFFSQRTHRSFLGRGPWARLQRRSTVVDHLLYAQIHRRRALAAKGLKVGDDIMSMLLQARYEDGEQMRDRHLRDTLLTLLFAGHETTSVAIAWGLYHLYTHPNVLTRLREELAGLGDPSPDEIAELPYLKAVCQETLRMHPVVPDVVRMVREELELDGCTVPAGIGISIPTCVVHSDPKIYPEPDRFRPERFLEAKPGMWSWLPFGGGHRRCIGAAFAMYELALVLATIVRRYDVEVCESRPVVPKRRSLTMGPSTGVRMRRVCTIT
ncbi:MAG TPA: cytochrome P450 [Nannocystis exedens]|nr:cytochrome P450 [Nannocystis exedens]